MGRQHRNVRKRRGALDLIDRTVADMTADQYRHIGAANEADYFPSLPAAFPPRRNIANFFGAGAKKVVVDRPPERRMSSGNGDREPSESDFIPVDVFAGGFAWRLGRASSMFHAVSGFTLTQGVE